MWVDRSTYEAIYTKARRISEGLKKLKKLKKLTITDSKFEVLEPTHAQSSLTDSTGKERHFLFKLRTQETNTMAARRFLEELGLPKDIVATTDGKYQVFFDFSKGLEEFTKALTMLFRLTPANEFSHKINPNPSNSNIDKILTQGEKNLMTTEGNFFKLNKNKAINTLYPQSYDNNEILEKIKTLKNDIYAWLIDNNPEGQKDFTLTDDQILFQVTKTKDSSGKWSITIQSDSNNPIKIQFNPILIQTQNYIKLYRLISKAIDLLLKRLGPSDFFDTKGNNIELQRDFDKKILTSTNERLFTEDGSVPCDLETEDVNTEYFKQKENQ